MQHLIFNTKKLIKLTTAGVIGLSSITGCGSGDSGSPGSNNNNKDGEKVEEEKVEMCNNIYSKSDKEAFKKEFNKINNSRVNYMTHLDRNGNICVVGGGDVEVFTFLKEFRDAPEEIRYVDNMGCGHLPFSPIKYSKNIRYLLDTNSSSIKEGIKRLREGMHYLKLEDKIQEDPGFDINSTQKYIKVRISKEC